MNKEAQTNGFLGLMLVGFVAIVIGVALLQSAASYTSKVDDTVSYTNTTYTVPTAGTYTDISDCQEVIGTVLIQNSSTTVTSDNVTIVERVGSDGLKSASLYNNDARWNARIVNATWTCGVDGYVEDAGSRSIISLIVIMMALAIAAIGLLIALKNGYIDMR